MLATGDGAAGWGQKIGFLFGIMTLLFIIPVWLLYPETKGRLYTEIDELYERKVPIWKFDKAPTSIRPDPKGPPISDPANALVVAEYA